MTIPVLFADLTNPNTSQLDTNFQFVGILGAQPCVVTGTNALTFTPQYTSVGVPSYQNGMIIVGVAAAANTAAVTAQVAGLTSFPVRYDAGAGPVALTGGEIQAGNMIVLCLDTTAGIWHFVNPPGIDTLNAIGATQGDVLYYGVSGWTVLPPGTAGQVLETGGAAANPAWKNFSAGSTAGTTSAISVTASPFTYTAGNQYETVYISGGTVSVVAVAGTTVFTATTTGCTVRLAPGKAVVVTYSVLPTMNKTVD